MPQVNEVAVLLALENRQDIFDSLNDMFRSNNYLDVFMALEEGLTQAEIAEKSGVGQSTVSRAVKDLLEFDLIEQTDVGYRKSLPVLSHPILQHYYEKEVGQNE